MRTPARYERDTRTNYGVIRAPGGPPALVAVEGARDFHSTAVYTYAWGYRLQATPRLSADAAGFTSRYRGLNTMQLGTPVVVSSPPPAHLEVPASFTTGLN